MGRTTKKRRAAAPAARMTHVRVRLERDEKGWWVATVPALDGCHTQGRSISQARERIREALDLFDVPADAELELDIVVGALEPRVRAVRELRAKADDAAREAQAETQKLVANLVEQGLSLRDVGALLDLSFQRVQQLVQSTG